MPVTCCMLVSSCQTLYLIFYCHVMKWWSIVFCQNRVVCCSVEMTGWHSSHPHNCHMSHSSLSPPRSLSHTQSVDYNATKHSQYRTYSHCFSKLLKYVTRNMLVNFWFTFYESQISEHLQQWRSGWFAVLKGIQHGCTLSPYLFNIMAELLMWLPLDAYEGEFMTGARLVTNLRYTDDILAHHKHKKRITESIRQST